MLILVWSSRNSPSSLGGVQSGGDTLKTSLAVSYKTKYILRIISVIVLPGIYPSELKTHSQKKNLPGDVHSSSIYDCKSLKKPRCPSVGEWIKKPCFMQTRRKLKCIFLSERSQSEKAAYYTI